MGVVTGKFHLLERNMNREESFCFVLFEVVIVFRFSDTPLTVLKDLQLPQEKISFNTLDC